MSSLVPILKLQDSRVTLFGKAFLICVALIPVSATYLAVYLELYPHILYPALKLLIVLLPFMVWKIQGVAWSCGMRAWWGWPTKKGFLSGAILASIILASYVLFFRELDSSGIVNKLNSLDILAYYVLAGLFISCVNSAIEEWFWRGFLHQQFVKFKLAPLTIVCGGGFFFGLHHYFTLHPYFSLGVVVFFTCVTMLAGALWSYQRLCGWSLVDCYVGHVCSDLAIIYIGWLMIS